MAVDLKLELFAHDLFGKIFFEYKLRDKICDGRVHYTDECSLDVQQYGQKIYDDCHYQAVVCWQCFYRRSLYDEFEKSHVFTSSYSDFCDFVQIMLERDDLFPSLSVFEQMFASAALIAELCLFCDSIGYVDFIKIAHLCWALYYDRFCEDFYENGGWKAFHNVAFTYSLPFKFLTTHIEPKVTSSYIFISLTRVYLALESFVNFLNSRSKNELLSDFAGFWVDFRSKHYNGIQAILRISGKEQENALRANSLMLALVSLCRPYNFVNDKMEEISEWHSLENQRDSISFEEYYSYLSEEEKSVPLLVKDEEVFYDNEQNKIELPISEKNLQQKNESETAAEVKDEKTHSFEEKEFRQQVSDPKQPSKKRKKSKKKRKKSKINSEKTCSTLLDKTGCDFDKDQNVRGGSSNNRDKDFPLPEGPKSIFPDFGDQKFAYQVKRAFTVEEIAGEFSRLPLNVDELQTKPTEILQGFQKLLYQPNQPNKYKSAKNKHVAFSPSSISIQSKDGGKDLSIAGGLVRTRLDLANEFLNTEKSELSLSSTQDQIMTASRTESDARTSSLTEQNDNFSLVSFKEEIDPDTFGFYGSSTERKDANYLKTAITTEEMASPAKNHIDHLQITFTQYKDKDTQTIKTELHESSSAKDQVNANLDTTNEKIISSAIKTEPHKSLSEDEVKTNQDTANEMVTLSTIKTELHECSSTDDQINTDPDTANEMVTSVAIKTESYEFSSAEDHVNTNLDTTNEMVTLPAIKTESHKSFPTENQVNTNLDTENEKITSPSIKTELLESSPADDQFNANQDTANETVTLSAIKTELYESSSTDDQIITDPDHAKEKVTSPVIKIESESSTATDEFNTTLDNANEIETSTAIKTESHESYTADGDVNTNLDIASEMITTSAIKTESHESSSAKYQDNTTLDTENKKVISSIKTEPHESSSDDDRVNTNLDFAHKKVTSPAIKTELPKFSSTKDQGTRKEKINSPVLVKKEESSDFSTTISQDQGISCVLSNISSTFTKESQAQQDVNTENLNECFESAKLLNLDASVGTSAIASRSDINISRSEIQPEEILNNADQCIDGESSSPKDAEISKTTKKLDPCDSFPFIQKDNQNLLEKETNFFNQGPKLETMDDKKFLINNILTLGVKNKRSYLTSIFKKTQF